MIDPLHGTDRRTNPHLRVVFLEACEVLRPFFDPDNTWGGQTHEHLAYRALHEQLPTLTPLDIFVLVSAAKRVFHSGEHPAQP
ncbi:MAG: hypothetical protein HYY97_07630 [Rhodocyclales bacterium]|nr:hypothetical protein [Rhodocyclales bacterium]